MNDNEIHTSVLTTSRIDIQASSSVKLSSNDESLGNGLNDDGVIGLSLFSCNSFIIDLFVINFNCCNDFLEIGRERNVGSIRFNGLVETLTDV